MGGEPAPRPRRVRTGPPRAAAGSARGRYGTALPTALLTVLPTALPTALLTVLPTAHIGRTARVPALRGHRMIAGLPVSGVDGFRSASGASLPGS